MYNIHSVRPYELESEGFRLDRDMTLQDGKGSSISFWELMKECDAALIFRISEFHCNACITQGLQILKDTYMQYGSTKKVIILGAFSNVKKLKILCQTHNVDFDIYNTMDDLGIALENINNPYFFILDKNEMRCRSFFITLKEYPELTISNLRMILQEKDEI